MKKTLRTVLTAAMFAAANMSALPTSAEELNTETVESQRYNWSEWGNYTGGSGWDDLERITGQAGQLFYGSFPVEDLNDHSHDWKLPDEQDETVTTTTTIPETTMLLTTTTVYPLYGPGPNWKTTTGTVPPVFTTTTTTMPQVLYGAYPLEGVERGRFGDVNVDGVVDGFDMIAMRKLLINGRGEIYRMRADEYKADVNRDGKVSIADLIMLQKYLLGQIKEIKTDDTGILIPEVEQVTEPPETRPPRKTQTTTTTASKTTTTDAIVSAYDPREDIVVSLYGIKPSKDIIDQAIFETKENIDTQLSSEDE